MSFDLNGSTRRDFMTTGMSGLVAASLAPAALAAGSVSSPKPARKEDSVTAFDPRAKLKAISSRSKQLWPVVYVDKINTKDVVERDVEASFEGGADAVVLEIGKDPAPLRVALEHVRAKYPTAKVGANYLGDETGDPYGFINGFKLAKEFDLDIVWTDFCGVDLVKEVPEISLHAIETARAGIRAFYVSGIHMKYGTLLDPTKSIEKSAFQAMGWVDGVIVTGPKTGVPTDPDRAIRARRALGDYPMGAASGVSVENFETIGDQIDWCLVNTSIADADHRILVNKVRALRQVMGG